MLKVRVGEFDLKNEAERFAHHDFEISRAIMHENYIRTKAYALNDLALLKVRKPIEFMTHIIPICLPREASNFKGKTATLTGWGDTDKEEGKHTLLRVDVKIFEGEECFYMPDTLCTLRSKSSTGANACKGDSGSPLTVMEGGRAILVGITSTVSSCDAPDARTFYTYVPKFINWINKAKST